MSGTFERRGPHAVEPDPDPDPDLVTLIADMSDVFDTADAYAALGDFPQALLWLERGEHLCGGLTPGYLVNRKRWQGSLSPLRLI